ncbi:hypothetical protein [Alkalicoccus chagannorensis]|uniref:hypothetical protein n=1 Tax=Alkalicoccus chagannorensis TaxID=427072 RepID=UPI0004062E12|nr:hypothetical protein [Alkalicoccus chagannorensis]
MESFILVGILVFIGMFLGAGKGQRNWAAGCGCLLLIISLIVVVLSGMVLGVFPLLPLF